MPNDLHETAHLTIFDRPHAAHFEFQRSGFQNSCLTRTGHLDPYCAWSAWVKLHQSCVKEIPAKSNMQLEHLEIESLTHVLKLHARNWPGRKEACECVVLYGASSCDGCIF